jgi:hypothetical protein
MAGRLHVPRTLFLRRVAGQSPARNGMHPPEPKVDQAILLQRLKMNLPAQPPPRVTAADVAK